MTVIETMTFRLAPDVAVDDFRRADARLQSDFAAHQPGLPRRTTASGVGRRAGEWIVVDEWRADVDADSCAARWETDPVVAAFMALVDAASVDVRRYAVV